MARRDEQFETTSSTDEVLEMVLDQHREIKQLLEQVASATGPERVRLFAAARRYLAVHETVEEAFIHPVGERELAVLTSSRSGSMRRTRTVSS